MKTLKSTRKNLEIKATQIIQTKIHSILKTQDKVVLAIPGGSSVNGIFSLLKKQNIPWPKVHIFMLDERLVPTDHPDSNYGQAYDSFIRYLFKQHKLPHQNAHPFIYKNLPKSQATTAYKNELKEISDKLDIALLSAGEDGHVASLFPNHDTIKDPSEFFLITNSSPKPPKRRISASRKLIQKSNTVILLFFGENKKQAYDNFNNKNLSTIQCPAKLINKVEDSYVLTDIHN